MGPVVHPELHFIGKKVRTSHFYAIHPKQKMALDIRDETCRFPGCTCKKHVDYHHVLFWSHDGFTDPDNLIKLCRFHHMVLHLGIYTIELRKQTDGNHRKWIFKTEMGEVIEPSTRLPPHKRWTSEYFPAFPQELPRALKRMFDYKYMKSLMSQ